jgi:hypothetical protein
LSQVEITETMPAPLSYILEHLRPEDRAEIEAVRGEKFDPFKVALQLCQLATTCDGWLFWNADTKAPIAALGAYAMTPTCAGCWAFGTPDWPTTVKAVTKHVRHIMIPRLLKAGFHRAECRALASREDTQRWLTGLGWRAEAVLSEFGTRREDFILFAWLADEHTNHLQ